MTKTIDINKKITVLKSLKAPIKLAVRPSGNNKRQRYRTVFMRDRDRILYSKSFRRLSGKTQVFLSGNDDHKRTRLTHTLEVAQIAKTIANSLKLDIDLTEAIALGHDIGHTPFGHAGERILHEIMTPCPKGKEIIDGSPIMFSSYVSGNYDNYFGFKHNLQSVNVALYLEKDYDEYGLDLTNFTLYGMNIHSSTSYSKSVNNANKLGYYDQFSPFLKLKNSSTEAWSFEAFVVKEADEIAQRHHDLEDAIRGNLISKDEVINQIKKIFSSYLTPNDRGLLRTMKDTHDTEMYISLLSRLIVNLFVNRITRCSIYNLNQFILNNTLKDFPDYMIKHSIDEVKNLIAYDEIDAEEDFKESMKSFETFLTTKVLSSYDIQTADAHGQHVIKKLFKAYYRTPTQLPDHCIIEYFQLTKEYSISEINDIIINTGMGELRSQFSNISFDTAQREEQMYLMRVICNQISGMTDTYAQKIFNELYS